MNQINDGTGKGFKAKVGSNNRLQVEAVSDTGSLDAITQGEGFNLNTGEFTVSDASAMFYLKNNETSKDLVIRNIVLAFDSGPTLSQRARMELIRNPTTGTIVTGASGVVINQNSNFASNRTLLADVYRGQDLATFTDGDDFGLFFGSVPGAIVASVEIILQPGASFGVTLTPNISSGGPLTCYVNVNCYLRDVVES